MSWKTSSKKECDLCGRTMSLGEVVDLLGMGKDLCKECAKTMVHNAEVYVEEHKNDKEPTLEEMQKELDDYNTEHPENTSKQPFNGMIGNGFHTCKDCGSFVCGATVGFSDQLRKTTLCANCFYRRIKELM